MRSVELPAEPAPITIDLDRTALIVVGWVTTSEDVATALTDGL